MQPPFSQYWKVSRKPPELWIFTACTLFWGLESSHLLCWFYTKRIRSMKERIWSKGSTCNYFNLCIITWVSPNLEIFSSVTYEEFFCIIFWPLSFLASHPVVCFTVMKDKMLFILNNYWIAHVIMYFQQLRLKKANIRYFDLIMIFGNTRIAACGDEWKTGTADSWPAIYTFGIELNRKEWV